MTAPALFHAVGSGRTPTVGRAAWEAAWAELAAGPMDRPTLLRLMAEAGCAADYGRNLLRRAVQVGHLTVVSRDQFGTPTLARAE